MTSELRNRVNTRNRLAIVVLRIDAIVKLACGGRLSSATLDSKCSDTPAFRCEMYLLVAFKSNFMYKPTFYRALNLPKLGRTYLQK